MEAALIYTEPPSYPRPVVEGLGDDRDGARRFPVGASRPIARRWRASPGSGRAYFGIAAALGAQNKPADAAGDGTRRGARHGTRRTATFRRLRQATSAAAR